MSKPEIKKMETELGNQIRLNIYRIPRKNHDLMMQNQKQFTDAFRKHGGYYQSFELSSTGTSEGFTSIASVLLVNQDEEVWMDLESYRDGKHMDYVISKLMNDKSALSLMEKYLALLSPGSSPIRAEFRRLTNMN